MREQLHAISEKINQLPYVKSYFGKSYFENEGESFYLNLKPRDERKFDSQSIIKMLEQQFSGYEPANVFFGNFSLLNPMANDTEIDMVLMTTGSYDQLGEITKEFLLKMRSEKTLINARSDLSFSTQQIQLDLNVPLARDLGVPLIDIASTVSSLYGGVRTDYDFNSEGQMRPIILSLQDNYRADLKSLQLLQVRSKTTGRLIPLVSLVTPNILAAPVSLSHFNGLRSVLIKADLAPGASMDNAIAALNDIKNTIVPYDMQTAWIDTAKQYLDSSHNMILLISMALLLIYLVLTIQFKSFIDPCIILLTVPLAFLGAVIVIKLTGGSLNLYTEVGLLTLTGLITKHGILIVDFIKLELKKGQKIDDSILTACHIRLKPIMMTTSAMILGALPLVFSSGEGSSGFNQIGWSLIGGLLFGTLSSLFVVPIAYAYLYKWKHS